MRTIGRSPTHAFDDNDKNGLTISTSNFFICNAANTFYHEYNLNYWIGDNVCVWNMYIYQYPAIGVMQCLHWTFCSYSFSLRLLFVVAVYQSFEWKWAQQFVGKIYGGVVYITCERAPFWLYFAYWRSIDRYRFCLHISIHLQCVNCLETHSNASDTTTTKRCIYTNLCQIANGKTVSI